MRETGRIREQRIALGLSQEALARRADCSTAMVRLLEAGYHPTASDVLPRLEAILNNDSPATNGAVGKERDAPSRAPRE